MPPVILRRIVFILLSVLLLAPSLLPTAAQETPEATTNPIPRPVPTAVLPSSDGFTVELFFDKLKQGGIGSLHVAGQDVAGAKMRFFNRLIDFFPAADDGFYGLIAVNMEQSPRVYDLSIFVQFTDGRRSTLDTQVEVVSGGYIRQDFVVPPDRAYLIDPQVERGEFARLDSIFSQYTPEHLWDSDGFLLPINSELTSPFGAFRTLNETVQTRHTGWDLRAAVGTPVMAMGSGRVVFAGLMEIRGNHVIIDHGYGIFSGYSHLSQIHVTRGQSVVKGQIIGVSGNTGRSNGPHLHWEIVVNGTWVDSVDFMQMWLP